MPFRRWFLGWIPAILAFATLAPPAWSQAVGQVKVVQGTVHIERAGQRLAAAVGTAIQQADVVVTGADGSVGITFLDNSLLSAGPGSTLSIDRFALDPTTHQGTFETSLRAGTLVGVCGKIAKQSPGAMRVRTPAAILGVRGTEFAVRARPARD